MEPTKSQNNFKHFFECVFELIKKNEAQIVHAAAIPEEPEYVNLNLPKETKKIVKNLGAGMLKLTGLSPTSKTSSS